jgi:hypothetical protein
MYHVKVGYLVRLELAIMASWDHDPTSPVEFAAVLTDIPGH